MGLDQGVSLKNKLEQSETLDSLYLENKTVFVCPQLSLFTSPFFFFFFFSSLMMKKKKKKEQCRFFSLF